MGNQKTVGKTIWGKQRAEKQLLERKRIEARRKERFDRTHPRKPGGTTVASKTTVTPPASPTDVVPPIPETPTAKNEDAKGNATEEGDKEDPLEP